MLDPSQLYLQVHESCGHPTELDRVFGTEASYAGTSFLTTDKLDEGFRYGSDLIDIVADATAPGGMGTFGWDDEGVAAQAVPLVKDGIFVGYLTQPRDGAPDRPPERWRDARRRLEPHPADPDDQHQPAAQARHEPRRDRRGHGRRAVPRAPTGRWSIDDRRLNFQFATEVAYEIKGGKKGRLFKNPTYTGITYEFWRSCDAVGDERSYVMLGTPNCGKGEPGQTGHVGHAVPGARFRDVQVGVGKW